MVGDGIESEDVVSYSIDSLLLVATRGISGEHGHPSSKTPGRLVEDHGS